MPSDTNSTIPIEEGISEEDLNSPFTPLETAERSSYYPFTLFLVLLWTALIVANLVLLEKVVAAAPTMLSLPWYYANDGLPTVLLTLFAQGHVAITALHLSRLAISSLQVKTTAPRTWRELFWSADGKWSGPLGIAKSVYAAVAAKTGLSISFVVFSFLTLVAVATPLVLGRAYPFADVGVQVDLSFTPSTLSTAKVASVDAYAQIAAGAGTWSTNLTAVNLFNSSVYIPPGIDRGVATAGGDIFFAGDVQGFNTTLPGVRITGSCAPLPIDETYNDTSFTADCQTAIPSIGDKETVTLASNSIQLNVSYCTTGSFGAPSNPSNTSALIYLVNGNGTGALAPGGAPSALIHCSTLFTTGTAALSGAALTFSSFTPDPSIYTPNQAGETLQDPLYAALYHMTQVALWGTDEGQSMSTDVFGYAQVASARYVAPSEDAYAAALWNGATHMAASIAILSRASDVVYTATDQLTVSGRVVESGYRLAAFVLLAVWFVGIVVLTGWMWRRTFDSALGHKQAAQLWATRNGGMEYHAEEKGSQHVSQHGKVVAREISGYVVDVLS